MLCQGGYGAPVCISNAKAQPGKEVSVFRVAPVQHHCFHTPSQVPKQVQLPIGLSSAWGTGHQHPVESMAGADKACGSCQKYPSTCRFITKAMAALAWGE